MLSSVAYDTLSSFRSGPVHRKEGATEMIKYLVELGYLKETKSDVVGELQIRTVEWEITPAGLNALFAYEEEAQRITERQAEDNARREEDKAFQEAQKRASERASWAAVAQVVAPIVTFILGLLIEHWTGFVGFILGLFK